MNTIPCFQTFYAENYPAVYRDVLKYCRDPVSAEDLTQDVFLKIWLMRKEGMEIRDPKSYVYRMAYHQAISYLRQKKRQRLHLQELRERQERSGALTEQAVLFRQLERLLEEAIEQLPLQRKRVYVLRKQEGWELRQIALVLGIKEPTVRATLKAAVRSIRSYIALRLDISRPSKKALVQKWLVQKAGLKAA